jgi:hypothetical protein
MSRDEAQFDRPRQRPLSVSSSRGREARPGVTIIALEEETSPSSPPPLRSLLRPRSADLDLTSSALRISLLKARVRQP